MISPLKLKEIMELHKIIGKYLPDKAEEQIDVLEYAHQIVENILSGNNPSAYVQALGIMSGKTLNKIIAMSDMERNALFVECVFVNRLWLLNRLLRIAGYDPAKQ